jgi:GNAT superfamily N-acetyltransferase
MKQAINKSFIKFDADMDDIVIEKLFVHPSQRGKKLGHKLLDIALDYARENEMNVSLCAESDEETLSNEKLIKYYEDYGFESDGNCLELMTYFI